MSTFSLPGRGFFTSREWKSLPLVFYVLESLKTGPRNYHSLFFFFLGIPVAVDLASTEYLSLVDGAPSGPGPDLPIHVWGHCLFAIDDYRIILNGGVSREHYSSARTYLFDSEIASWTEVCTSISNSKVAKLKPVNDE